MAVRLENAAGVAKKEKRQLHMILMQVKRSIPRCQGTNGIAMGEVHQPPVAPNKLVKVQSFTIGIIETNAIAAVPGTAIHTNINRSQGSINGAVPC